MDLTLLIAICEDCEDDTAHLHSLITQSSISIDSKIKISFFKSGKDFLRTFRVGKYDLIFMDIFMEGMRGIEAAEVIRQTDADVMLAFTTSSPDYTREGYQLKALKYLDKPVLAKELQETLELALMRKRSRPFITITKSGGKQEVIVLDNILYFEQQKHVIEVYTTLGVVKTSQSMRLDEIEKYLPPKFLRCHGSFIINLDYALKADRESYAFVMKNGGLAHIRRGRFTEYKAELEKRRMDGMWGDVER